jgi:hypothetical protein
MWCGNKVICAHWTPRFAVGQQRVDIIKDHSSALGWRNNADLFQSQLDLNALIQSRKIQELTIEQAKTSLLTTPFFKARQQHYYSRHHYC